ncbi:O-antigen ligase family protein [Chelonobacter oris]|uniref:O-antigen ligase family protein n=1 Tax=Chelonobacter oris TaxID=505317 RepID=UPI0006892FCE|nr:O-antigen ligase family protein [Chelonobacter oris]
MLNNSNLRLSIIINSLIFLFFTPLLLIKKSYYIAPLILLIIALLFLVFKKNKIFKLTPEIRTYVIACSGYFLVALMIAIIHHDKIPTSFKAEMLALLTIPILILFLYFRPDFKILSFSLSISAILVGCHAIYDKFFLGTFRALSDGAVHIVITGGIIMTIAMLCCAISIYHLSQQQYKNALFSGFAAIMGILAGFFTGSRGSWLIFPFIILLLFVIYWKSLKKLIPVIGICILTGIAILTLSPQTGISERYHQAIYDITHYTEQTEKTTSIGMRFELWKSAWYGFLEKPVFGWGKEGMFDAKKQQIAQGIVIPYTLAPHLTHAHNQFLEQMFFRGSIGLIALLAILFIPLIHFSAHFYRANSSYEKLISLLGIINILTFLSYNLSDVFLTMKESAMFYYMLNAIIYAMLYHYRQPIHMVTKS